MEKSKKASGNPVVIYAVIWVITYGIILLVIKKLSPGTLTGVLLSLLPLLAFALFIYHYIRNIGAMDELQVRIQLEAAVIAFALGLLTLMTLGLLDLTINLNKEDWGYRHLIPYFAIFYFMGLFISKRKYS